MVDEYSLAGRISAEELVDFVEQSTYHPDSTEDDLRKRVVNPKEIGSSRRAATALGLVKLTQQGKIGATELGRRLVYAKPEERSDFFLREVLMEFEPYEIPLERILGEHSQPFDLETDAVERVWTLHFKMKHSKDTLDRSALTLLKFLDFAGVGEYLIGRRGKPTRLEMSDEGYKALSQVLAERKKSLREGVAPRSPEEQGEVEEEGFASLPAQFEVSRKAILPRTPGGPTKGHQVHQSKDGDVVLHIVPSKKAIQWLKLLLPVLEFEVEAEEEVRDKPPETPEQVDQESKEELGMAG